MEKLLTVLEAAEVLGGVSASTLRFWVRQGKLAHTRLGRRLLFTPGDLERFVAAGRVERAGRGAPAAEGGPTSTERQGPPRAST